MRVAGAVLVAMLLASRPAVAGPITIEVLSASYTTSLFTDLVDSRVQGVTTVTTTSRTLTSLTGHSDAMIVAEWPNDPDRPIGAIASAELLAVSAYTRSGYVDGPSYTNAHSRASAESAIEFSPVGDGLSSLLVDFTAGQNNPYWSEGYVRLVDLTAGELLWDYQWHGPSQFFKGTVPWIQSPNPDGWNAHLIAGVNPEAFLLDSHVYGLTLFTSTNANYDNQGITIDVSGLHTVPEPASMLLLTVGLGTVTIRRWRRRHSGAV